MTVTTSTTQGRQEHRLSRPFLIRPGRPSVRTTFQLAADLYPTEAAPDVETVEAEARRLTLAWLAGKYPEPLPDHAAERESFDLDVPGQVLNCVALQNGSWSARLVQPDARSPVGNREAVAGRTWTTDICLARVADRVRFGIRVQVASLPETAREPIRLTRPRVVVDLSNTLVMRGAGRIHGGAWKPETEGDLDRLIELLADPRRELPLYLLTQPHHGNVPVKTGEFVLDHRAFARRVQGLGYVVTMPWSLGYKWTERVGKPWSAFMGAIRTYMPGLDFEEDSPGRHPRALLDRILGFQYRGDVMEPAFERFLIDRAYEHAASRRVNWDGCAFYLDARRRQAELRVATAATGEDKIPALESKVDSLEAKIEQLEAEAEEYNDDALAADQARAQAEDESERLRLKVESLNRALAAKTSAPVDAGVPIPSSYDDLSDWVAFHLTGRLLLHSRALRGLKKAQYADVESVCRVLLLLANEYRDMRLGHDGAKERFESALDRDGLRCDGSITPTRAGEQGDTYFVRYPYSNSERVFVEYHIRSKGNTRDPSRCLAIYFFWDGDTGQVVVCWLPSHLDIRSSN